MQSAVHGARTNCTIIVKVSIGLFATFFSFKDRFLDNDDVDLNVINHGNLRTYSLENF